MAGFLAGFLAGSVAHAGSVAYLDEVAVHGGVTPDDARSFVHRLLGSAGYTVAFVAADRPACAGDPACLSERGKRAGAVLAGAATFLVLAGDTVVVLTLVDVATGRSASHTRPGVALGQGDPELLRWVLVTFGPAPSDTRGKPLAWTMASAGVALAVAGGLALVHADAVENDFHARHVNDRGQVHSISRVEAEAWERRAKTWAAAGWISVGLAGGSGIAATLLFLDGDDSRPRTPTGVAIGGSF
jgi:hypothetical protein